MNRLSNTPPLSEQIKEMMKAASSCKVSKGAGRIAAKRLKSDKVTRKCTSGECIYYSEHLPFCDWVREYSNQSCQAKTTDNRLIGVDGRKIKYRKTADEISLKKSIDKFLPGAIKIEKKRKEKERKAALANQRRRIKEAIEKIVDDELLSEADVMGVKKYNIKSLI